MNSFSLNKLIQHFAKKIHDALNILFKSNKRFDANNRYAVVQTVVHTTYTEFEIL